jgi:hypothetical protein
MYGHFITLHRVFNSERCSGQVGFGVPMLGDSQSQQASTTPQLLDQQSGKVICSFAAPQLLARCSAPSERAVVPRPRGEALARETQ